jgi:hypothetical protein
LKQQLIDSLEKQLAETKESLSKVQSMSNEAMESQLDRFNTERKELQEKIERLTVDATG